MLLTKEDKLKELLNMNFEVIFEDLHLFIENIPSMVKLIGLQTFLDEMNFTKTQYYSRTNAPGKWGVDELQKAKAVFTEFGLGKNKHI